MKCQQYGRCLALQPMRSEVHRAKALKIEGDETNAEIESAAVPSLFEY